jgi:hypothetical protein
VDYTTNAGVYVIDGNLTDACLYGKPLDAAMDHMNRDLLLMQTVTIDAMPQQTYVSAADNSTGGFNIVMIDRVGGDGTNCQTMTATIVNEGGQLVLYFNASTKVDLGVSLVRPLNF